MERRGLAAAAAGDAELAMAMQVAEIQPQRQDDSRLQRIARVGLVDQLWGELPASAEKEPSFVHRFAFSLCPCCFVPCASSAGRRAWRRFLLSWSTAIAGLQVVALLIAVFLYGDLVPLDENPLLGPHYHTLDALGAKNTARILQYREWWRFLTPMLLHTGFLHLLGNLLVQLRTGALLECLWGHSAWLLIYVASGAYSALASCVALPKQLSVGSSGALCGLIGAWLAFSLITWNQTLPYDVKERDMQVASIGFSIVLILALSFLPLLDYAAHLGGLLAGASLAMALFAGRLQHAGTRLVTRGAGFLLSGAMALGTLLWLIYVTEVDERLLTLCDPADC